MKRLIVVLAAVVAAFGLPTSASSVTLHSIAGDVLDPLGRPLEGVTVTEYDGGRYDTTNAQGRYVIEVPTGTYLVTASRTGLESTTATVTVSPTPVTTEHDFMLYYTATATPSPVSVSTAKSSASIAVTIATGAPSPGLPGEAGRSCVKLEDSRTGTVMDATYSTTSGGLVYWKANLDVPKGSTEGNFELTPRAVDCASGATLSNPVGSSSTYTVDNTPPAIPLEAFVPADGTNTVHGTGQPLLATVKDGLSGVLSTSIKFELYDQDGTMVFESGPTDTTRITWNALTGQAVTPPLPTLQAGKLHFLRVIAKDKAGNRAEQGHRPGRQGGGFLVTSVSPNTTSASLPDSPCTVSADVITSGTYSGMKQVTCPSVAARLAATSVTLGGARHIDSGYVSQTFGLDTAIVAGTVSGAPATWPAFQADDPNWHPKTKSMRYSLDLSSSQPFNVGVPAADVGLGTLVTYVPGTFDSSSASLRMGSVSTVASTTTCPTPADTTTKVPCSPDPLDSRFIVSLRSGVDGAAVAARHASQFAVEVRERRGLAYSAFVPPESLEALAKDADVAGVRRETVTSELYPDDWDDTIGDIDEAAIVTEIETQFAPRYLGSWIDRSVMPAVWRVAVKDVVAEDYSTLAAITSANERYVLESVGHSEADFDSYITTAEGVLTSHGVQATGYGRDIPRQRLEIQVETVTQATVDALLSALPAGVPRIATGYSPGTRIHQNRFTGLPVEGGLVVTSVKTTNEFNGACTTSFAAKRSSGGSLLYGGVSAGHCMAAGDDATLQEQEADGVNSELRNFPVQWSGWYAAENGQTINSDGAVFALDGEAQTTKDVLVWSHDHRRIRGKLSNSQLVHGRHTCFQGTTSATRDGSGTFDNCGTLGMRRDSTRVGPPEDRRVLRRSWCFGPVTANPGDSGGPVYDATNPNVTMMGIVSSTIEYPVDLQDIWDNTRIEFGESTEHEPTGDTMYACFTSIGDFENASGWLLHY